MSAAAPEIIIYTGVTNSVNDSTLEPLTSNQHMLKPQYNKPTNPLRHHILTPGEFYINGNDTQLSFRDFIKEHGTNLAGFAKGVKRDDLIGRSWEISEGIKLTLLGYGTFSSVFKLELIKYDKVFIIKCMNDVDPTIRRHNRREIKILFYLKNALGDNNWCIVHLHAAAFIKDACFLLYEYIPGSDLFAMVAKEAKEAKFVTINNSSLPPNVRGKRNILYRNEASGEYKDKIKKIADRLIEGLAYIHSVGVIHNDIKPENIMIPDDPQRLPFFIDFDAAGFIEEKRIYNRGTLLYLHKNRETNPREKTRNTFRNRSRESTIDADLHAIEKTFLFSGVIDNDNDENGVNIDFKEYKDMYEYYRANRHKGNNASALLNAIRAEAKAVDASPKKEEARRRRHVQDEQRKAAYERQKAAYEQQQAEIAASRQAAAIQAAAIQASSQSKYASQFSETSGKRAGGRRKTKNKCRRRTRKMLF
jgi:hypothetical protein